MYNYSWSGVHLFSVVWLYIFSTFSLESFYLVFFNQIIQLNCILMARPMGRETVPGPVIFNAGLHSKKHYSTFINY